MPTICQFNGIIIMMRSRSKEHEPPHIHAYVQGFGAPFLIATGELMEGRFPPKEARRVKEFVLYYREELLLMWETGQCKKLPPKP